MKTELLGGKIEILGGEKEMQGRADCTPLDPSYKFWRSYKLEALH
jgi:hypothetical protein